VSEKDLHLGVGLPNPKDLEFGTAVEISDITITAPLIRAQAIAFAASPAIDLIAPLVSAEAGVPIPVPEIEIVNNVAQANAFVESPEISTSGDIDLTTEPIIAEAIGFSPSVTITNKPVLPPVEPFPTGVSSGGGAGVGGWKRNPSLWDNLTEDVVIDAPELMAHAKMTPPAFVIIDGLTSGINEEEDEELIILALHHFQMI
jgi:hypothetical protein